MYPLPSRIGLLLGRICVYIQHLLVATLVAKLIVVYIPNPLGTILQILPFLVVIGNILRFRANAIDYDREMMRSRHSSKPDYWQYQWMQKSRFDIRTPKDAWRVVQCTAIFAFFTAFFLIYTYSYLRANYPSPNLRIITNIEAWIYVTFLLGPFFGHSLPFERRPPLDEVYYRPNDDDPDGNPGISARVRPPTPVLAGGNHFPDDRQRYG